MHFLDAVISLPQQCIKMHIYRNFSLVTTVSYCMLCADCVVLCCVQDMCVF